MNESFLVILNNNYNSYGHTGQWCIAGPLSRKKTYVPSTGVLNLGVHGECWGGLQVVQKKGLKENL